MRKIFVLSCAFLAFAGITMLLVTSSAFAIPIVTNGSMNGTAQIGSPPPGWTSVSVDGDTIPVGGLSGWATGIGASSDGGTFLALLNNGGGGSFDAVQQSISGFTIGQTYSLDFSFANVGLDTTAASNYANSGFIRANIAGVDLDSALLNHDGFGSQTWFNFSDSFIATGETLELTLSAVRIGVGGYAGGIDGVSINATSVPEPMSLALVGIGLIGLAFTRRKLKA
jgi:hypothetical protein